MRDVSSGNVPSAGDQLVLVDVLDRQVGTANKDCCHAEGLLHRAFSVFLVRDGEVLLQRRAFGKYHSGGLWTNACCSHPREGEAVVDAATRRLREELGVFGCTLREVGSFVYRCQFTEHLFEFEYDHVLLGVYDEEVHGALAPDPSEVMATRWVSADELAAELTSDPDRFTAWFMTAAPMVLAEMRRDGDQA